MGQFLCIGIRTTLAVKRKQLDKPLMSAEEICSEFEKQLVPPNLYEKLEFDDYIVYRLRDDAVRDEFIPFLKEFYNIRYEEIGDINRGSREDFETISEYSNLTDWVKLAEKKCMEVFQIDRHYGNLSLKYSTYIDYHEECIILSLTGKVWMECYGALFQFLLNCIKHRLPQFRLKDTLSIFITD